MAIIAIPSMAVTYVRNTGEHSPATIIGPSRHGENDIYFRYMQNEKEIEHNAAFDKVLFQIRSPSFSASQGSPPHLGTWALTDAQCIATSASQPCPSCSLAYWLGASHHQGWDPPLHGSQVGYYDLGAPLSLTEFKTASIPWPTWCSQGR